METYKTIQLKPTDFVSYLLSSDVGFETCTTIATPDNAHKGFTWISTRNSLKKFLFRFLSLGFQRSIYLFIKPSTIDSWEKKSHNQDKIRFFHFRFFFFFFFFFLNVYVCLSFFFCWKYVSSYSCCCYTTFLICLID